MTNDPNNKNVHPLHKDGENGSAGDAASRAEQDAARSHFFSGEDDPLSPTNEGNEDAHQAAAENGSQELQVLKAELEKTKAQALRALAEAENTRKRALKEREDAGNYAISAFARDLLDFSDNFRRALSAIPEELVEGDERIKNVVTGISAMEKELLNVFTKHGIQKIDPLDEKFDPNHHEVMFEVPATGKPPGTIMQVVDPGYVLKSRLLRPARVGVAKDDGSYTGGDTTAGGGIDQEV